MSAQASTNPHQFEEMHRQLQEGGFTYNPRTRAMVGEGFSVAQHPEATHEQPYGGITPTHLEAYTKGSAPIWSGEESTEHIGGWRRPYAPERDVLDLPNVYPATGAGESQARQATIHHGEEAYNALHRGFSDVSNPFHPATRLGQQFPEFSRMSPEKQLRQPEVQAWIRSPKGSSS
jgi:hypothetical protein